MSRSKLIGAVCAVAFVTLASTQAWAQVPTPPPTAPPPPPGDQSPSEPATNLSLGYAYMHDFSWDENLMLGWVATLSHRMSRNLSIVGEAGGSHGEFRATGFTIQRYAFLGGIKLSGGEGQVRPFFQVLAGWSRQGGDVGIANGVAIQPGGGADLTINEWLTLRAQGDYRFLREGTKNWTGYRFSGGVVIYLGKKK